MAVSGVAAANFMSPGRINEASACLYTVWLAYGSPHSLGSLAGHTFPTAISAASYTTKRHYDRNPPEGAAVWFGACAGPRYSGDTHWRDGDVTVSRGNGRLGATDYPVFGLVGECTIAQRETQTGRDYLYWTSDFLGNDITLAATASITNAPRPVTVAPIRKKRMTDMILCYIDRKVVDVPGKAGVRNATYKNERTFYHYGPNYFRPLTRQEEANGIATQIGANAFEITEAELASIKAATGK